MNEKKYTIELTASQVDEYGQALMYTETILLNKDAKLYKGLAEILEEMKSLLAGAQKQIVQDSRKG